MTETDYPVDTLAQMALIPEDRVHLFIAELPAILRMLRQRADLEEKLKAICGDIESVSHEGVVWCDDGATNMTVNFKAVGPDDVTQDLGSLTIKGDAA